MTRRVEIELSESVWAELHRRQREEGSSLSELADNALSEASCDPQNLFAGIRVGAPFDSLTLRAACPARPGEGILEATYHQSEYRNVAGTMVGFWAPEYARSVGVPGYHFHFISDNRQVGGHVLDLRGGPLDVGMQVESGLHLAIPETAAFLSADLSGEHGSEIEAAETRVGQGGYDPEWRRPP